MATGTIKKELAFRTTYSVLPPGTSEYRMINPGFVFIIFSNTEIAIYGISGTNAKLLCGNIPTNASVSCGDSKVTVQNPNTWNGRIYIIG